MICPKCNREIPDDAIICCYCRRVFVRGTQSHGHKLPNGSGGAYKKGRSWVAEVTIGWFVDENGKRHRRKLRKCGFKSRLDALAYCNTLFQQNAAKKKVPSLAEYYSIYEYGEMDKLSQSKITAYKIAWSKLAPLHMRTVDSLTVSDLRCVVSNAAQTYYPARDMKVLLSHLFKLAAADGFVSKDLPSFIVLPDKNEKTREPFTQDEQAALWRAYESGCTDAAIPLIMIYTGMMTGEMRHLTAAMIDFDAHQICGVGLKTEMRRAAPVYLPNDIIPVLQDVSSGKDPEIRIYDCSEDSFYARYYAALDEAGVRHLTPYSCRHTTATSLAITENIAPETVRKIMRWTSTAMLSRYAHPNNDDAISAINHLTRSARTELQGVTQGVTE